MHDRLSDDRVTSASDGNNLGTADLWRSDMFQQVVPKMMQVIVYSRLPFPHALVIFRCLSSFCSFGRISCTCFRILLAWKAHNSCTERIVMVKRHRMGKQRCGRTPYFPFASSTSLHSDFSPQASQGQPAFLDFLHSEIGVLLSTSSPARLFS